MDASYTPPGYYGTRDVARALHTSPGAVRNLVYRGRLTRAGGTERHPWYRAEDVTAILVERRTRSAA
ncbi:hypothetical protein [Streptomyces parvulus]|uniref:hypothetical protein n=1 Tax=Streptomyces parvulus TaxID=146923 RepID=UPI0036B93F14